MGKKKDNSLADLKKEEERAKAELAAEQAERAREADAIKRRKVGRASLINTSELGVIDELG